MRTRRHPWLTFLTFCVMLASTSSASAQSWLSDRKRTQGHGIRLGDLELHPGIGAEAGYYTNMFYASRDPVRSAALRVSPHLYLSTLGAERSGEDQGKASPGLIRFVGGVSGTFQYYFKAEDRTAIGTDLNLDFTLAPERPVGLRIFEILHRGALPFSDTELIGVGANAANVNTRAMYNLDFTNYSETAGAQLLFQSSGGLLKGAVGYRFGYAWFDETSFQFNNNMTHGATFQSSWEFLPKTALFYDALFTRQIFTRLGDPGFGIDMAPTQIGDNSQLASRIGLNGAITSRLGTTIAVGYAAGFFPQGDDYEGLIGNLEARYRTSDFSEVALAADRGFLPSYLGNFQRRDRVYARLRWMIARVFVISSRLGVEFLKFGFDTKLDATRSDRRYFGDLSGEYRFVDWLAATGQANMLIDDTTFAFSSMAGSNPAKFTAFEFWLGLRAFY